jgi:electron transfer flavoprotein alpha subunit
MIAVVLDHDRGTLNDASLEALTFARTLSDSVTALICGGTDALAASAAEFGASSSVLITHELLSDYGPEAWGESVAQWVRANSPDALMATGIDRGNEIVAQVAARLDLPMVANCLTIAPSPDAWSMTRVQWGGSLLEDSTLRAPIKLVTVGHHAMDAVAAPAAATSVAFTPELDSSYARTVVTDRVVREAGVTLTTARVVVGGGRAVGSAEGFAPLEELAGLLGGVVGCSRAVTNNGWRNHTDQVGQTGTRIAPDIYLACGISGAIQHWVGAMASKKILAINTDKDANMVTRADYAVIADLHKLIPAISEEIKRRRA